MKAPKYSYYCRECQRTTTVTTSGEPKVDACKYCKAPNRNKTP